MDENFKLAVENVLLHEGGYVNNPADPGGESNFGISKHSYPTLDIKNLTREDAINIYYANYWLANRLGEVHDQNIATKFLNLFVNIGKKSAEKVICRALRSCGFEYDEKSANITELIKITNIITANSSGSALLASLKSEIAGYYRVLATKNPSLKVFLNGWLNRAYS
jgi:lysozyme family protein